MRSLHDLPLFFYISPPSVHLFRLLDVVFLTFMAPIHTLYSTLCPCYASDFFIAWRHIYAPFAARKDAADDSMPGADMLPPAVL